MAIGLRVQGDLAGAKKNYLEALAIRRDIGEKAGMAQTLNNLANLMSDEGDLSGAMKLYEETRRTAEEIGDKQQRRDGVVQPGRDAAAARKSFEFARVLRPGVVASSIARGQECGCAHAREHRHGAGRAGTAARGAKDVRRGTRSARGRRRKAGHRSRPQLHRIAEPA